MMLPEHLELIRLWKQEQFYDERRELTEWELEVIEQTIQYAFKMQKYITLTLWNDHKFFEETGLVTGIDTFKRELLLDSDELFNDLHLIKSKLRRWWLKLMIYGEVVT